MSEFRRQYPAENWPFLTFEWGKYFCKRKFAGLCYEINKRSGCNGCPVLNGNKIRMIFYNKQKGTFESEEFGGQE